MTTTSNLSPVQVLRPDSASRKRTETSRELPARRRSSRLLAPFPEGWYLVASRRAGERATLLSKTSMGKVIVVWCDDQGTIGVADARCPHCGSHLGRQAGGRVRAGRLACACRGFEFGISGGGARPPPPSPGGRGGAAPPPPAPPPPAGDWSSTSAAGARRCPPLRRRGRLDWESWRRESSPAWSSPGTASTAANRSGGCRMTRPTRTAGAAP